MAKNPHAQALGKLGGLARAAKLTPEQIKAISSRAGKAGGWPKGRPRKRSKAIEKPEQA